MLLLQIGKSSLQVPDQADQAEDGDKEHAEDRHQNNILLLPALLLLLFLAGRALVECLGFLLTAGSQTDGLEVVRLLPERLIEGLESLLAVRSVVVDEIRILRIDPVNVVGVVLLHLGNALSVLRLSAIQSESPVIDRQLELLLQIILVGFKFINQATNPSFSAANSAEWATELFWAT